MGTPIAGFVSVGHLLKRSPNVARFIGICRRAVDDTLNVLVSKGLTLKCKESFSILYPEIFPHNCNGHLRMGP